MIVNSKVRLAKVARLGWLYCSLGGLLVGQPSLRITSPRDGAVVNPGQSLTVTVEASPTAAFKEVVIIGGDPIGFSQPLSAPPYRFTILIPKNITARQYLLTADGYTVPGKGVSASIRINVERADSPVSLDVYPSSMHLSPGHKGFLSVSGKFSDGENVDLSKASRIVYTSDTPSVAAVQADGTVTAVASGVAKVEITYGKVKARVPVTVEGVR